MQTANTYTKENQHTKKESFKWIRTVKYRTGKQDKKKTKKIKTHTHTQRNVKWLEKVDKEERQARKENLM